MYSVVVTDENLCWAFDIFIRGKRFNIKYEGNHRLLFAYHCSSAALLYSFSVDVVDFISKGFKHVETELEVIGCLSSIPLKELSVKQCDQHLFTCVSCTWRSLKPPLSDFHVFVSPTRDVKLYISVHTNIHADPVNLRAPSKQSILSATLAPIEFNFALNCLDDSFIPVQVSLFRGCSMLIRTI